MSKLDELKKQLELSKVNLKDFDTQNSAILNRRKELKAEVSRLEEAIEIELNNSKPKFPVENLDLGIFSELFSGWGEKKVTQKHIDEYLSQDSEVVGLEKILGWSVVYEDNSASTHTDGDFYDYSLTVTSPEGYAYSAYGETCMAVGEEFEGMELE